MPLPPLSDWYHSMLRLPPAGGGPGEVTLAGTTAARREGSGPRQRVFGQYALVYLVEGEGFYRDEHGRGATIRPGDWILVFPEIAHSYGPVPGAVWHELYVCFRGAVFEAWRSSGTLSPAKPTGTWLPPVEGVREFRRFFAQMEERGGAALSALCRWQELLGKIVTFQSATVEAAPRWLEQALDLLGNTTADSARSLQEVARCCGVSYETFRKKFVQQTGSAPWQYVQTCRIGRARQLIRLEQLTNQEIASLLGFYDEFHFSKVFTRLSGMTPRQFRRSLRSSVPGSLS